MATGKSASNAPLSEPGQNGCLGGAAFKERIGCLVRNAETRLLVAGSAARRHDAVPNAATWPPATMLRSSCNNSDLLVNAGHSHFTPGWLTDMDARTSRGIGLSGLDDFFHCCQ